MINNKIFTLKYALQPQKRGLGSPQKAGIAVGASAGLLAFVALIFALNHRRRSKEARDRGLSGGTEENFTGDKRNSMFSQNLAPHQHLSELPSEMPVPEQSPWLPALPVPVVEPARADSPVEMPGSTYMDEHHPAYSGVDRSGVVHQAHVAQEEDSPSDLVSPLDGLEKSEIF